MKRGFTLIEILTAVIIVTILVTMAVPMYEKTIEKSRIAEARSMLKRIYESKGRLMDELEINQYNTSAPQFGFENLDYTFRCEAGTIVTASNGRRIQCGTKDFNYHIAPTVSDTVDKAHQYVCAQRNGGDNAGTNFLYGVNREDGSVVMWCNDNNVGPDGDGCEAYGMSGSNDGPWCD